jgi:protoporphyrinogen oxidase
MSKISIVGAGITGLAVANLASKSVSVFEASKNLGGILRDLYSEGYSFFWLPILQCRVFVASSDGIRQNSI